MEHDIAHTMMMDALDGELAADQRVDLEAHLRACLSCSHEWQTLLAIDTLFRQAPLLSPAAGFAQRTLARLPNRTHRIWTMSVLYFVLLAAGAVPILLGMWAVRALGPVLADPGLPATIIETAGNALEVLGTLVNALLSAAGDYVLQQPATIGWLFVMIGVVSLWGGVFRQVLSPQPQRQVGGR